MTAEMVPVTIGIAKEEDGYYVVLEGPSGRTAGGPMRTEDQARAYMALAVRVIEALLEVTGVGHFHVQVGSN